MYLSPATYLRLAAAGGLIALAAWTHWQAYSAGRRATDKEREAAVLQAAVARADALERLAEANGRMVQIEKDAAERIAAAQRRAITQVHTVERIVRENPDFAAVARPADLQRVRDADLAAIAEAAGRSAELSANGVRGVRRTADEAGSNTR